MKMHTIYHSPKGDIGPVFFISSSYIERKDNPVWIYTNSYRLIKHVSLLKGHN